MKYLSKELLDGLYAQTESQLAKIISQWQQLPAEFFTAQSGPGKRSAAQCLEHLNSYGRFYLPAMEKAIGKEEKQLYYTYFKSGLLGNYFYRLMLPGLDGKPKKKMRSPEPSPGRTTEYGTGAQRIHWPIGKTGTTDPSFTEKRPE